MKTKFDLSTLSSLNFKQYEALLKKEMIRAKKELDTSVVLLSDFAFACGTTSALFILGKYSGELSKFYKTQKKERAQEKDFARGNCSFSTEGEQTKLAISLLDGKAKIPKIMKHGRKTFKKLKLQVKIAKGKGTEETETVDDINDDSNNNQELLDLYKKGFKDINAIVLPALKARQVTKEHQEITSSTINTAQKILQESDNDKLKEKIKGQLPKIEKVLYHVKDALFDGIDEQEALSISELSKTVKQMSVDFSNVMKNKYVGKPHILNILNLA